jgi:hypothetical protein
MRRPGAPALSLALALLAALAACRTVEGPIAGRDAMGRLAPPPESPDAWRYVIDAEVQAVETPADAAGSALPAGLRAIVEPSPGIRGGADAHAAVEGVATPVPVGEAVWNNDVYRSPATRDPVWNRARVAVEWVVLLRSRGGCFVEVEIVPRLLHASGCVARLDEFRVVRRLALDDALVFGLDPRHPAAADARALFGARAATAPAGTPLRLALRVRAGA